MRKAIWVGVVAVLAGCSGGDGGTPAPATASTLAPGQSMVLASGTSVLVPATTTVRDPSNNNSVVVNGDHNTVHTSPGSVVSVPATATGPADNTVSAP